MPLSTDSPAPVSAIACRARARHSAARSRLSASHASIAGARDSRAVPSPCQRCGRRARLTGRALRYFGRPMSAAPAPIAGIILAGGRASRMGGRDKAFAAVAGEPIAVRTVRLFRELFAQVLVATNRPARFDGLGVETVADAFPGCGPLAGIHAAATVSRFPHVFVAACDMPALDADV